MEIRYFDSELRATDDADGKTILEGYAALFNSLSQVLWDFREKIAPGAFAETIADDIRALWNHDTATVLGRTRSGTLRLREDDMGLATEIDPPKSAAAQVESIQRGDVTQMSFGFQVLDDEWDIDDDGMAIRTLKRVKLFEVSPVTFPAYVGTSIGLRSTSLGDKVEIPAELRQETNEAAEAAMAKARARIAYRQRQIAVLA